MRIAIVHDWLVVRAGAESVLQRILMLFPNADVYSIVNFLDDDQKKDFNTSNYFTSFIQKMPFAKKHYRNYLFLMPLAVEQLDLSAYDLIISSSHAVAKGVLTGPDQIHISYVHSPIRYAWDLQHTYLKEAKLTSGLKSIIARLILHYIRQWDRQTANGVDFFIANSQFIARRIQKVYARTAQVIYPPVELGDFQLQPRKEEFYLTVSRFVPYKKIPLIVEAFANMPDKKLIVIGDGPEMKNVRARAQPNVTILGYQSKDVLISYMQRARAFIFAAEEDFGIVCVEAQACGTPVIGFGKGGTLETVVDGETGVLFKEQSVESITDAVRRFESIEKNLDPASIRRNAERFASSVFDAKFKDFVDQVLLDAGRA